ncbi:peptidoglycan D,D-transpeptidase FtsI family protein [Actinokineospora fastidiosa]|uniref:Cell division protein FtsI n=1 Tax=Actinokineospora fastidiosa TaxID=1816 RepID=A0A918GIJ8_9PSEU|nr:penicillin-binding transpeptidase domain-containing protein [Actinokineospora fastidiosa]GGS38489.1 cell division protein FtsI [Actinokineospora fastidiosa]
MSRWDSGDGRPRSGWDGRGPTGGPRDQGDVPPPKRGTPAGKQGHGQPARRGDGKPGASGRRADGQGYGQTGNRGDGNPAAQGSGRRADGQAGRRGGGKPGGQGAGQQRYGRGDGPVGKQGGQGAGRAGYPQGAASRSGYPTARGGGRSHGPASRRTAPSGKSGYGYASTHGPGVAGKGQRPPGRRVRNRASGVDHRVRVVVTRFVLIASLVAAGLKLVQVQVFEAEALAARAERQRVETIPIPAARGAIVDRNGVELAFSVEARSLAWRPRAQRQVIAEHNKKPGAEKLDYDKQTADLARLMVEVLGSRVSEADLLEKLRSDKSFVYLVHNIEPAKARLITDRFPQVNEEYRAVREYPGGSLAANIVGVANWRMDDPEQANHNLHGLVGLELLRDNELSGNPGSVTVETKEGGNVVIPGSERNRQPAVDGADLELTIDADLQFFLQQKAEEYAKRSGAQSVSVVVLDAKTGEVYGLANDKTFDASKSGWDPELMTNPAVTTPYEPGSVNKVVTAMGAIEYGLTTPTDVYSVAGKTRVADRIVRDAWSHGQINMTTTGIFGKSSNVGTLILADKIGPDRFADLLAKLGIGQRTNVGLPGESPGSLLPQSQWSGSTFGNLPIGQGLSMTVLQMAGMYQTIANDGVRVPPRIVKAVIKPDGTRVEEPRPEGVRVVSPQTARTTVDMFRAVAQDGPGYDDGTAPKAALTGYQISGKTGTAQQYDKELGRYSDTKYWVTFAGILPADDPRFVVGMVYDRPVYSTPEGHSAAPFFHDVASFLAQRYNIPLSAEPSPVVPLVLP